MTPAPRQYKDAVESLTNVQEQLDAAVEQMQLLTASYNQAHKRPEAFDGDYVASIQADMSATSERIQRLRVEVAEADAACARLSRASCAQPVAEARIGLPSTFGLPYDGSGDSRCLKNLEAAAQRRSLECFRRSPRLPSSGPSPKSRRSGINAGSHWEPSDRWLHIYSPSSCRRGAL